MMADQPECIVVPVGDPMAQLEAWRVKAGAWQRIAVAACIFLFFVLGLCILQLHATWTALARAEQAKRELDQARECTPGLHQVPQVLERAQNLFFVLDEDHRRLLAREQVQKDHDSELAAYLINVENRLIALRIKLAKLEERLDADSSGQSHDATD